MVNKGKSGGIRHVPGLHQSWLITSTSEQVLKGVHMVLFSLHITDTSHREDILVILGQTAINRIRVISIQLTSKYLQTVME